jgi:hypothetical protein
MTDEEPFEAPWSVQVTVRGSVNGWTADEAEGRAAELVADALEKRVADAEIVAVRGGSRGMTSPRARPSLPRPLVSTDAARRALGRPGDTRTQAEPSEAPGQHDAAIDRPLWGHDIRPRRSKMTDDPNPNPTQR